MTDRLGPFLLGPNDTEENGIYCGDARELSEQIPDESIDLIFTDPPYPEEFLPLFSWLSKEATRILKPDGFVLCYSGHYHFRKVLELLEEHLEFFSLLCVWEPGLNARVFPKQIIVGWNAIFMMRRKDANKKTPWIPNAMSSTFSDKRFHKWGQNFLPVRVWTRYLCSNDGVVFDPFIGGGTLGAACKVLGRKYLGFDIDEDAVRIARQRVRDTQPPLFVLEPEQKEFVL